MFLNWRKLGVVIGLCLPFTALAATLKIATVAPDGTTWMREIRAAGERVEKLTEGRVKLKFYPGGVMGSADTVLRKMRVGQLQGGVFTSGELAEIDHDMFLYNIPFLFRSEQEVLWVRQSLDPMIKAGMQQHGLVVLAISGGGFAYVMSARPVASIQALADAKVWTPEGDVVSEEAFRLAGVSPIPLPLSDVYTQLQTGAIDTAVNTTTGTIAFQWHTKMRYMADYPIIYVTGVIAVDARAFARLSAADQGIVRGQFEAAFEKIDSITVQDNSQAREALVNQGIEILPIKLDEVENWRRIGRDLLDLLHQSDSLNFDHLDDLVRLVQSYREQNSRQASGESH